jgi:cytosine/adenosine deaminase-related metal-dependent hydrolase
MSYQKFIATQLFTGHSMLDANHVLIAKQDGTIDAIVPLADAGDGIQQLDGILSPGLINCHCHLELSHMKGLIPEHTGLVDFIWKIVTQRHFPQEEILAAIAAAEEEMLNNGIVAIGDIANNDSTVVQKQKGNLHYYNFIELSGWHPNIANDRFQKGLSYKQTFQQAVPHQPIHFTPHAPYSVSPELWQLMEPDFSGNTVSIHNQETAFEDDYLANGTGDFTRMYQMMHIENPFFTPTGKSSLVSYLDRMNTAKNALLVHNTFTNESDIQFAQSKFINDHLFFCLCINANQYIENSIPPVDSLRNNNCNIVLGTDSLASNHSLNIVDEMKTLEHFFPQISIPEMLGWATLNGAKALQLDTILGSFEKGKKPGVVLLENWDSDDTTIKRLM